MINVINKRLTKEEAMMLIKGQSHYDGYECIRPNTEEYSKLKAPYPRWLIGCSRPSFAAALVPYKEKEPAKCS